MELFFKGIAKFFHTKTGKMLERAFLRSFCMAALLIIAGGLLEFFIELARFGGNDVAERFPEILIIFRAVSILAWFEMSIFWLRLATQPGIDLQFVAHKADGTAVGAALLYITIVVQWLVRMIVLMQLCGFWK